MYIMFGFLNSQRFLINNYFFCKSLSSRFYCMAVWDMKVLYWRENHPHLSQWTLSSLCLSLKQQRKIYQCCVRPVLLYCCETWELTVADEARLCEVKHGIISMMCGVRLVDRVLTDVLCGRVGVVVKIKDMII